MNPLDLPTLSLKQNFSFDFAPQPHYKHKMNESTTTRSTLPNPDAIHVTLTELTKLIQAISERKAQEPDYVPLFVIKRLSLSAIIFLTNIYKVSLKAYIPKPWKLERIVGTPKPNKNPHDPNNYCPISLLMHA